MLTSGGEMPPSSWNVNEFLKSLLATHKRGVWLSKLSQSIQKKTELANYDLIQYFYHRFIIIHPSSASSIQKEAKEWTFKWRRGTSTNVRINGALSCCYRCVCKIRFNLAISFLCTANSFQLSTADHCTSWSDLSDPLWNRLAVMLWADTVSHSRNWLCGISYWSCPSFDGN